MFRFFVTTWLRVRLDGSADFIWFLEPAPTSLDLISILEHACGGLIMQLNILG